MTVLLATVILLALGGCGAATPTATPAPVEFTEFYADANITGEVAVVAGESELQLQLRLRNHGERTVQLTESTRCTVLRWTIIDARGNPVQTMPGRRCAQQLAARALRPAQTIARAYAIPLTVRNPGRYTVRFSFWGYPGEYVFEMR